MTYQTNNFLGLGETLTLSANIGTLQRNVSFGFTEPYLFDRPISTGFTVFASRYNFDQARQYSLALGYQVQLNPNTVQNYIQNSDGFTVFASYPVKKAGLHAVGPDLRIHLHEHHGIQHGVHARCSMSCNSNSSRGRHRWQAFMKARLLPTFDLQHRGQSGESHARKKSVSFRFRSRAAPSAAT